MLEQNTALPIEWLIKQGALTEHELQDWNHLLNNSSNVTSTNLIEFNLNGVSLCSLSAPIYVLGYSKELDQNLEESKDLRIALILVKKQKSMLGIKFGLLQPVSHDHVDMMSILGAEHFNNSKCVSSLIKELNRSINSWSIFSARRLRDIKTINQLLISPNYARESAYFHLKNDKNTPLEIKNIIPKKLYKNISRFERKIESEQQTVLQLISYTTEEDVNTALSEFFTLEASGWKGEAGSAIQCNSELENFYRKSWGAFACDNFAKIFVLKSGDSVIASGIAFQTKDELILHKIAFDESLSQYGPGSILVKQIIQNAIDEGQVNSICFNTNPPWLKRWKPHRHRLVAIQIFNTNFKGNMFKFLFGLADKLRTLKRQLKKVNQQRQNK